MHKVGIVVPIYRQKVSADEQVALQHLYKHLGRYEVIQISPSYVGSVVEKAIIANFADDCFANVNTYSKLLLSKQFYEAFRKFDYILIYQLDCLVFCDDLQAWCEKGYDYIGAPLLISKSDPSQGFSRVGNGGFSLRRVRSFIEVLTSSPSKIPYLLRLPTTRLPDVQHLPWPIRMRKTSRVLREIRHGVDHYIAEYGCNEDLFWSDRAHLFNPNFKVAPLHEAFRFAFEMLPQQCFAITGRKLPFGAHAWQKWDRAFWEPHLIGEQANDTTS